MFQCIEIEMNREMADEIEKRAASLQMSASQYIKLVLQDCIARMEPAAAAK